jgi:hypothetical protein
MHDIKQELEFFTRNPQDGQVLLHPILGEETNPFGFNSTYVEERAVTFDQ